jgi:hypothetical protein
LDRDAYQAEIKKKQAEIEHNKRVGQQLHEVKQEFQRRYTELKKKVDVCPYCEASLVELKDYVEEDYIGSLRRYDCGFEAP